MEGHLRKGVLLFLPMRPPGKHMEGPAEHWDPLDFLLQFVRSTVIKLLSSVFLSVVC